MPYYVTRTGRDPQKLRAGGTERFPELGLEGQTGERRCYRYRKISTEFRELKCESIGDRMSDIKETSLAC